MVQELKVGLFSLGIKSLWYMMLSFSHSVFKKEGTCEGHATIR